MERKVRARGFFAFLGLHFLIYFTVLLAASAPAAAQSGSQPTYAAVSVEMLARQSTLDLGSGTSQLGETFHLECSSLTPSEMSLLTKRCFFSDSLGVEILERFVTPARLGKLPELDLLCEQNIFCWRVPRTEGSLLGTMLGGSAASAGQASRAVCGDSPCEKTATYCVSEQRVQGAETGSKEHCILCPKEERECSDSLPCSTPPKTRCVSWEVPSINDCVKVSRSICTSPTTTPSGGAFSGMGLPSAPVSGSPSMVPPSPVGAPGASIVERQGEDPNDWWYSCSTDDDCRNLDVQGLGADVKGAFACQGRMCRCISPIRTVATPQSLSCGPGEIVMEAENVGQNGCVRYPLQYCSIYAGDLATPPSLSIAQPSSTARPFSSGGPQGTLTQTPPPVSPMPLPSQFTLPPPLPTPPIVTGQPTPESTPIDGTPTLTPTPTPTTDEPLSPVYHAVVARVVIDGPSSLDALASENTIGTYSSFTKPTEFTKSQSTGYLDEVAYNEILEDQTSEFEERFRWFRVVNLDAPKKSDGKYSSMPLNWENARNECLKLAGSVAGAQGTTHRARLLTAAEAESFDLFLSQLLWNPDEPLKIVLTEKTNTPLLLNRSQASFQGTCFWTNDYFTYGEQKGNAFCPQLATGEGSTSSVSYTRKDPGENAFALCVIPKKADNKDSYELFKATMQRLDLGVEELVRSLTPSQKLLYDEALPKFAARARQPSPDAFAPSGPGTVFVSSDEVYRPYLALYISQFDDYQPLLDLIPSTEVPGKGSHCDFYKSLASQENIDIKWKDLYTAYFAKYLLNPCSPQDSNELYFRLLVENLSSPSLTENILKRKMLFAQSAPKDSCSTELFPVKWDVEIQWRLLGLLYTPFMIPDGLAGKVLCESKPVVDFVPFAGSLTQLLNAWFDGVEQRWTSDTQALFAVAATETTVDFLPLKSIVTLGKTLFRWSMAGKALARTTSTSLRKQMWEIRAWMNSLRFGAQTVPFPARYLKDAWPIRGTQLEEAAFHASEVRMAKKIVNGFGEPKPVEIAKDILNPSGINSEVKELKGVDGRVEKGLEITGANDASPDLYATVKSVRQIPSSDPPRSIVLDTSGLLTNSAAAREVRALIFQPDYDVSGNAFSRSLKNFIDLWVNSLQRRGVFTPLSTLMGVPMTRLQNIFGSGADFLKKFSLTNLRSLAERRKRAVNEIVASITEKPDFEGVTLQQLRLEYDSWARSQARAVQGLEAAPNPFPSARLQLMHRLERLGESVKAEAAGAADTQEIFGALDIVFISNFSPIDIKMYHRAEFTDAVIFLKAAGTAEDVLKAHKLPDTDLYWAIVNWSSVNPSLFVTPPRSGMGLIYIPLGWRTHIDDLAEAMRKKFRNMDKAEATREVQKKLLASLTKQISDGTFETGASLDKFVVRNEAEFQIGISPVFERMTAGQLARELGQVKDTPFNFVRLKDAPKPIE